MLRLHLRHKGEHLIRREAERLFFKNLRTDMAMIPLHAQTLFLQCIQGNLFRRAVRQGKAEFAVRLGRLNKVVRMRLHPGIDAD